MESPAVSDTVAAKTRKALVVLVRSALYLKVFAYEQQDPERFWFSQHRLQTVCSDIHMELLRNNSYAVSSQPSFTQIHLQEQNLAHWGVSVLSHAVSGVLSGDFGDVRQQGKHTPPAAALPVLPALPVAGRREAGSERTKAECSPKWKTWHKHKAKAG